MTVNATAAPAESPEKAANREKMKRHLTKFKEGALGRLADLDLRYDKTLRKSLTSLFKDKAEATRVKGAVLKIQLEAKEEATELLAAKSDDLRYGVMVSTLQAMLEEGRIEVAQLDALADLVQGLEKLEFMRYTEHGKMALHEASQTGHRINRQFQAESAELGAVAEAVKVYADGRPPNELADEAIAARYHSAKLTVQYAQKLRVEMLQSISDVCSEGFHFEVYKALAKMDPDKASLKLKKDRENVQKLYNNAKSAASGAGTGVGYVSGTAGMAIDVALTISDAGMAFIDHAIEAADWKRQAKAAMEEQKKNKKQAMDDVAAKLNAKPLAMAQMLADKYINTVKYNLAMARPAIKLSLTAAGVGLDQVGAGAATILLSKAWDILEMVVVEIATSFQNARLDAAAAEIEEAKRKAAGRPAPAAVVVGFDQEWQNYFDDVEDRIAKKFKENAVGASLNLADTVFDAINETTVSTIANKIFKELSVQSAQTFTGDEFLAHANKMENVRKNAEDKVRGVKEPVGA
ncbi:hypothetical protein [Kribbella monticola]|uniref:hypothetical protein n=1 Tax=Kribbella monticola TaxID=2185285 RepID=UPI000DD4E4A9|nr:hypothetical protein [Kribbella monticola]